MPEKNEHQRRQRRAREHYGTNASGKIVRKSAWRDCDYDDSGRLWEFGSLEEAMTFEAARYEDGTGHDCKFYKKPRVTVPEVQLARVEPAPKRQKCEGMFGGAALLYSSARLRMRSLDTADAKRRFPDAQIAEPVLLVEQHSGAASYLVTEYHTGPLVPSEAERSFVPAYMLWVHVLAKHVLAGKSISDLQKEIVGLEQTLDEKEFFGGLRRYLKRLAENETACEELAGQVRWAWECNNGILAVEEEDVGTFWVQL